MYELDDGDGTAMETASIDQTPGDGAPVDDNGEIPPRNTQSQNSAGSRSSTVCRICQLDETESGIMLEATGCDCKGSISMCHPGCIQYWIDVKNSAVCELCNAPMRYEITPRDPETQDAAIVNPRMRRRRRNERNCHDGRRTWFILIFSLLLMAMGSSIVTLIYIRSILTWIDTSRGDHAHTVSPEIKIDIDDSLNVVITISMFCVTMAGLLGTIWTAWEWVVCPKEIEMSQQIHAWVRRSRPGAGRHSTIQMVQYEPNVETTSL